MSPEQVNAAGETDVSTELSMRRTGMSFQRTRMSADRTLMSVIRTSLSLISFGFTIFQFFAKLREANQLAQPTGGARNFGAALVWVGVFVLVGGIVYHILFMSGLRKQRESMKEAGLIHAESLFPASLTLMTAILLLAIGLTAAVSIAFKIGPFD